MNILIPHSWLLDHLETTATPQEIQRLVSLSGPSIERIHTIEDEPVYDIEVTTNRVDSMSVRGVAREMAVILSQAGIPSSLKPLQTTIPAFTSTLPLPRIVNDPKLCKRILCQVVAGVSKTPAPDWMQQRLRLVGINVHDAVIDITNYITHDLGHPCHAFDYDKVMQTGGVILIKEAQAGKTFQIIDGETFTTVGGEVVFENEAGDIIDLPAIKGTKNTAIQDDTKNVLFWMETLDPAKVRFASMTHAIRTVAAQLSEKNVDPTLASDVFDKGVAYFASLAGGSLSSERYDDFPGSRAPRLVSTPTKRIEAYLGVLLPATTVQSILENLGCQVEITADAYRVTPPSFRPDLEIPEDIIEEVARIYGYHHLPSVLMPGEIPYVPTNDRFDTEHAVKQLLATLGATELYTYSMISEEMATLESRFVESAFVATTADIQKTHVKIKNPLTDDMVFLRRTLWVSHLSVLLKSSTRKELGVFEFANVYIPSTATTASNTVLPTEELHLTLSFKGNARFAKGMVSAVLSHLYLSAPSYQKTDSPFKTIIHDDGLSIGTFLTLPHSDYTNICIIDLDWRTVLSKARAYPTVVAASKFTPITEDLTFTVPPTATMQVILDTIRQIPLVTNVEFVDIYKHNATFSLTYAGDKQLTAEDATQIRKTIIDALSTSAGLTLVGTLQ